MLTARMRKGKREQPWCRYHYFNETSICRAINNKLGVTYANTYSRYI